MAPLSQADTRAILTDSIPFPPFTDKQKLMATNSVATKFGLEYYSSKAIHRKSIASPEMKSSIPIHLLLRFSDTRLKDGDTIAAHNEVVNKHDAVWFGKMGSPVSQKFTDRLNEQVQAGIPTFAYLVKGNRRKSIAYKARLLLATRDFPHDEQHLIPPYYTNLDIPRYVRFWVYLAEILPISLEELNRLQVASSVLPLAETLVKSSTGHFILREGKGFS